jgi:hypothetical protein
MHLEFLLEEPSAEAFLQGFLPRILASEATWNLIKFQGKLDLLSQLESRLRGYRAWLPEDWRIVVLVDGDRQDCKALKAKLDAAAASAGLRTKTQANGGQFVVLNRVAVEELEAWFLGDVEGLRAAYPGVSPNLAKQQKFRDPDAIAGGTWETLEKVLQKAGHFRGGLGKIELSRTMARHIDPGRNRSRSFRCFMQGLESLRGAS